MESRSVYLGIAVRLRAPSAGALARTYLHSAITEGLLCAVAESENLFMAKLAHALMLSSLYGNSAAKLDEGNDQVHEMYLDALHMIPYLNTKSGTSDRGTAELVEEWRRINAEEAAKKAAAAKEGG